MTHLKAIASPRALKIHRKEKTWVMKPAPGPHGTEEAIPLGVLIRDILGLADNRKEVRYLLNNGDVLVDGRVVKDENYPVGLLDVLSIPKAGRNLIVLVDNRARLYAEEMDAKGAGEKLCKLTGKTTLKGGVVQLNLHDGKNILIKAADSKKYTVGGTVVIRLQDQKILEFMPRREAMMALVAKGRHAGKRGRVEKITGSGLNLKSLTTLACDDGTIITNTDYIIIIGDKRSKI